MGHDIEDDSSSPDIFVPSPLLSANIMFVMSMQSSRTIGALLWVVKIGFECNLCFTEDCRADPYEVRV